MYRILLLILALCALAPTGLRGDTAAFLQTTARRGDGIYALLRRYQLDQYSCNFSKFYSLNRLKKDAPLVEGKTYFLPIQVYTFNGKTIRSSIGINDWDLAVAIQEYNETMHQAGLRDSSFRTDRILWVPFHLQNCREADLNIVRPEPVSDREFETAVLPEGDYERTSNPAGRNFPIFGPAYANTPLASNKLQGKIFYLVSGHGGPDPGAIGKRAGINLCEDEYAYDVALRLCRNLLAHGATAYMITRDPNDGIRNDKYLKCDEDEIVWGGSPILRSQKGRLTQRSDIINELYERNRKLGFSDQTVIVIHVDSRAKGERTDVFFYHQADNPDSRNLAETLHQTMLSKYRRHRATGEYLGTVTTRDLHMLRETLPTTVYIELANIRNTADQQRIILESNRTALANWLFEGLSKK